MLVGGVLDEAGEFLSAIGLAGIAKGLAAGAEGGAEFAFGLVHVPACLPLVDGEVFQRGARGTLGGFSGVLGDVFEVSAKFAGKGGHLRKGLKG